MESFHCLLSFEQEIYRGKRLLASFLRLLSFRRKTMEREARDGNIPAPIIIRTRNLEREVPVAIVRPTLLEKQVRGVDSIESLATRSRVPCDGKYDVGEAPSDRSRRAYIPPNSRYAMPTEIPLASIPTPSILNPTGFPQTLRELKPSTCEPDLRDSIRIEGDPVQRDRKPLKREPERRDYIRNESYPVERDIRPWVRESDVKDSTYVERDIRPSEWEPERLHSIRNESHPVERDIRTRERGFGVIIEAVRTESRDERRDRSPGDSYRTVRRYEVEDNDLSVEEVKREPFLRYSNPTVWRYVAEDSDLSVEEVKREPYFGDSIPILRESRYTGIIPKGEAIGIHRIESSERADSIRNESYPAERDIITREMGVGSREATRTEGALKEEMQGGAIAQEIHITL